MDPFVALAFARERHLLLRMTVGIGGPRSAPAFGANVGFPGARPLYGTRGVTGNNFPTLSSPRTLGKGGARSSDFHLLLDENALSACRSHNLPKAISLYEEVSRHSRMQFSAHPPKLHQDMCIVL